MILVVTSSFDRTCDYLISKYHNIPFFRLNTDKFSSYELTVTDCGFKVNDGFREIDSLSCGSIYFRKPVSENLEGVFEAKYHQFAWKECYSVVEGIAEHFEGPCLSRPSCIRRAGNKTYQALVAKKSGLRIPEFAITNSKKEVQSLFFSTKIVKPLASGEINVGMKKEYVQTNKVKDCYDLESIRYSPAYFQRYVDKDYEVRVTVIGKEVFAVRIDSDDRVDWRKSNNLVRYSLIDLPGEIYVKCVSFLKMVNMDFGCFDFIILNDVWFFLEMNANGQWAWLEFETGAPISNEIMRYLHG